MIVRPLIIFAYLVIFLLPTPFLAPPSLVLIAPSTGYVNEPVLIDARQSVGVSRIPQANTSPSVTIDFGDGFNCNLLACGHAFRNPGTYTITVTGKDSSGVSASTSRSITIQEIPAASAGNTQVLSNTGDVFTNRANLQTAINLAASRNTVEQEIVLPEGSRFANIITTQPVGNKYITIRTAGLSSLPRNQRVSPADKPRMASILSVQGGEAFMAPGSPSPVNHYRLQGIHVGELDSTIYVHNLTSIGYEGGPGGLQNLAHHFIIDRCYFDGGPNDTDQVRSGLSIWADYVSVVDSWFGYFRIIGSGVDSQALGITIGQGPYAFVNNHLSATSECVNLGSGGSAYMGKAGITNATVSSATLEHVTNLALDQNIALPTGGLYNARNTTIVRSISGNSITFDPIPTAPDNGGIAEWQATPSFIEFRGNLLTKPLKWWREHLSWNGQDYQLKNNFESKFARYMVIDGNVMENHWISAQVYSMALTVRNRNGGESHASVIRELQISNNIFRNVSNGIVISQSDDGSDQGGTTQKSSDITIRNNLFQNLGKNWDSGCCTHMMINLLGGANPLRRIFILHNTTDPGTTNPGDHITDFGADGGAIESLWSNNVHLAIGGFRDNFTGGVALDMALTIRRFLPPGDATNWTKNLIVNKGSAIYPPSGIYVTGSWPAQFVNYAAGDFTLAAGSPGKLAGTDGKDVGIDMAQLRIATAGAVSGVWGPQPSPTPTPPEPSPTPTPAPPSPTPTPEPEPSPSPSPQPSPLPTPTPAPCSISAPAFVSVPVNGIGQIGITLNSMIWQPTRFTVFALSSNAGQLAVFPASQDVTGTSAVITFGVKIKRRGANVMFSSPCGSHTTVVGAQ